MRDPKLSVRVALRHLTKDAAGSEEDIRRHLPDLKSAYDDFVQAVQDGKDRRLPGDHRVVRRWANRPWINLIEEGHKVADGILSNRSIPSRKNKGMEMAFRLVSTSRRMPRNVYKWWDKNQKRFDLLIEGAERWPEKEMGTDELFKLGAFTVHNIVGAEGSELEALKRGIKQVEAAIKRSPVPGLKKVLYGDIHVVPKISKAHHAAWYYPSDDSLYVRRTKATGLDEVHAMIHELGHRFWHRFANSQAKEDWYQHHVSVSRKEVDVEMPDVGDELPVRVRKFKTLPKVTRRDNGLYHYVLQVPNSGDIYKGTHPEAAIKAYLIKKTRIEKVFPTPYSSKNDEEHFCDALAMLCLGTLDDEHAIPFQSIWA